MRIFSIFDYNRNEEFIRGGRNDCTFSRLTRELSMKNSLYLTNFRDSHKSGCKIDSEKLGYVKGLPVCFAPFELRVARLCLALCKATKEVLEGLMEPLDSLLKGLGVGVFEKGVIPLQFDKTVVQVVPTQVGSICFIGFFCRF